MNRFTRQVIALGGASFLCTGHAMADTTNVSQLLAAPEMRVADWVASATAMNQPLETERYTTYVSALLAQEEATIAAMLGEGLTPAEIYAKRQLIRESVSPKTTTVETPDLSPLPRA